MSLEKRIQAIEDAIIHLTMDNILGEVVEDRTDASPNTQKLIPHDLGKEPQGFIILFGDVYIKDWDETQIDIRSTQASVDFKIKLLR